MRSDDGELELRDYLGILKQRWRWAALPLVLLPLLALVMSLTQSDEFRATARVLVAPSAAEEAVQASNANAQSLARSINNEINLAGSDRVEAEVRSELGLADDEDLPEGTIAAEDGADVLSFTFTADTAEGAADAANTWADAYVAIKRSDATTVIDDTIADLQADLADLQTQRTDVRSTLTTLEDALARSTEANRAVAQLRVDREASRISGELSLIDTQITGIVDNIAELKLSRDLADRGSAEVFERAEEPVAPVNASLLRNLILALVLGTGVGVGAALLRHNLDRSIKNADDVEELGFAVLSVVPTTTADYTENEMALVGATHPGSALADAYQRARTAIQFAGQDVRSIVVTSPNQGDGKTTTSTNLAVAFASTGKRVVLIDADLRRPRIHDVFATPRIPGLTDVVSDSVPMGETAVRTPSSPRSLLAVPAGSPWPSPASFLSGAAFQRQAAALSAAVDLVVYDAPPVLAVSDALSVAQQTDGVVLVVRARQTTRDELVDAAQLIANAGGKLLGVVLIGVADGARYGDYYRADEGEGDAGDGAGSLEQRLKTARGFGSDGVPSLALPSRTNAAAAARTV